MLTKKKLDKTIKNLPETFTIDELIEQLLFTEKVEEGIMQADNGKVITNEDVRLMIEKWSR
jgi:predicted transcriptional regulator